MAEEHPPPNPPAEPSPSAAERRPRIRILLTFLGVFVLLIAVFRSVLFPFLMAIYIAYLVEPIVAKVIRSRLLGLKWTRGPTLVAIYVLVLGGLAVLGWVGIAKLAKTIRSTSRSIAEALEEDGHRAMFMLQPLEEPKKDGDEPKGDEAPKDEDEEPPDPEKGIVIPEGTKILVKGTEYETLYSIKVTPEDRERSVLLEHVRGKKHKHLGGKQPEPAQLMDVMRLTYVGGGKIWLADAERLEITAGEEASGLEYFLERRLISPIVNNLAEAGFDVEPTLVRDFVAIQGEAAREDLPTKLGKGAVTVAGKLVLSIYEFFLILMLTAFIVMDRRPIAQFFASLPPDRYKPAYLKLVRYVDDGLAGVIRGQLVICGVNGVLTYIGLLIFGVPYALLLSFVAAVFSLIPVFGTIISSIPIVLIAATEGIDTGMFALAWILLIHALEANIFNPLIMGSHARMHPVIIIFALLAGEHAFGIWGALLAVPTASIIQSCFRFYLHEVEGLPRKEEGGGPGAWLGALWGKLKARFTKGGGAAADAASGEAS